MRKRSRFSIDHRARQQLLAAGRRQLGRAFGLRAPRGRRAGQRLAAGRAPSWLNYFVWRWWTTIFWWCAIVVVVAMVVLGFVAVGGCLGRYGRAGAGRRALKATRQDGGGGDLFGRIRREART